MGLAEPIKSQWHVGFVAFQGPEAWRIRLSAPEKRSRNILWLEKGHVRVFSWVLNCELRDSDNPGQRGKELPHLPHVSWARAYSERPTLASVNSLGAWWPLEVEPIGSLNNLARGNILGE